MRGVTRRAWMATALASLAGCSALDVLNAVSTSDASVPALGLPYGAHPRQRLDVYRPVRPMEGPPRAVVFFYGGSWREGDRKDYAFVGEALAAAGSIAMVADYRLYPEVRYQDFLLDCAAATAFARRWLDRQGYADARLFVAGHSAGAYNAAMLATDSRWLAMQGLRIETLSGWIGMAGPYNFLPIQAADVRPVFNHPNETADSQPLFHVRQDWLPPALLLTGEHDAYVDVRRNTLSLAERLTEYRHPVELKVYPRLDHKTLVAALASPLQFLGPVLSDVARFVANA